MAPWLISLGATTLGVLLVLLVILLGHLRRLARSLQQLQEDLAPLLHEIRDGSEQVQERLVDLERRREVLGQAPGTIQGRR
jgi:hypothetical protein